MKILVIDNDINTAQTIKASLGSKTDYSVDLVYSGKDGLEKMRSEPVYDLLILDIMMPEVSGIEVCKTMMTDEKLKSIPVLLTSALPVSSPAFQESLGKFDELSVIKDTLEKPFSIDDLVTKVNHIVLK